MFVLQVLLVVVLFILTLLKGQSVSVGYCSLRKDYYLPQYEYREQFASAPDSGGRVHIIFTSNIIFSSINISYPLKVEFNNNVIAIISSSFNLIPTGLDWILCQLNYNTNDIFISFHTQIDSVITNLTNVIVSDSNNNKIGEASFNLPPYGKNYKDNFPLSITWVTTSNNYTMIHIHIHNYDELNKYNINNIVINGVIINESMIIYSNEHIMLNYNLKECCNIVYNEGDIWTIGMEIIDNNNSKYNLGWGGKIMKEIFVFESYPHSSQCPYPGANTSNYKIFLNDLDLDTALVQNGYTCNTDINIILNNSLYVNFNALVGESYTQQANLIDNKYYPTIIGLELGDEVDSNLNNTYKQWVKSLNRREWYPILPTYQGGHVNHYIGAFAGIMDIQALDYYIAGCAPKVDGFLLNTKIKGSYDYLLNTRLNHMPLMTWGYTQAFYNPPINGNEFILQISSVFVAGCHGLMLFQSDINSQNNNEWNYGSNILNSFYLIREELRIGDINGAIYSTNDNPNDIIIEIIQSLNYLIIVLINTDTNGYNNKLCDLRIDNHWIFYEHIIPQLNINIPLNYNINTQSILYEIINGNIINNVQNLTVNFDYKNNIIGFNNIILNANIPTRILLIPKG